MAELDPLRDRPAPLTTDDLEVIDRFVNLARSNPVALLNVLGLRLSKAELEGLAFAISQRAQQSA